MPNHKLLNSGMPRRLQGHIEGPLTQKRGQEKRAKSSAREVPRLSCIAQVGKMVGKTMGEEKSRNKDNGPARCVQGN